MATIGLWAWKDRRCFLSFALFIYLFINGWVKWRRREMERWLALLAEWNHFGIGGPIVTKRMQKEGGWEMWWGRGTRYAPQTWLIYNAWCASHNIIIMAYDMIWCFLLPLWFLSNALDVWLPTSHVPAASQKHKAVFGLFHKSVAGLQHNSEQEKESGSMVMNHDVCHMYACICIGWMHV